MRRLRQMQQAGGRGGGGGPQMPRGSVPAILGGALLIGGGMFLSNALFNVDGGQRAIKYRRISGVSKDIYNEGENGRSFFWPSHKQEAAIKMDKCAHARLNRYSHQHSVVRNPHRLRRASETPKRCVLDGNKGSSDGQHYLPCPFEAAD